MEGDRLRPIIFSEDFIFQSTPSAWRETSSASQISTWKSFQSTPSAWRETLLQRDAFHNVFNFNPLPPHGGRLLFDTEIGKFVLISIHSLRMEGDPIDGFPETVCVFISIHSLRMEGDTEHRCSSECDCYFNPLPPHGGRHCAVFRRFLLSLFQSTPSAWRETCVCWCFRRIVQFQSTPSAWRETDRPTVAFSPIRYFNPLPPHGGRPHCSAIALAIPGFQSTPSAWRETEYITYLNSLTEFQSTPSAWRETRCSLSSSCP